MNRLIRRRGTRPSGTLLANKRQAGLSLIQILGVIALGGLAGSLLMPMLMHLT